MPAPDISRQDIKHLGRNFLIVLAALFGVTSAQAQNPSPISPSGPPPPPGMATPQNQKGGVIKSSVDLVVLHTTVVDDRGNFVADLKENSFRVFEDKVEQKLSVFNREDIPVTMGLVVDNSGSMREKRAQVNAAALSFVRTSNPQDEAFVVNFNDEFYLDINEDFTNDSKELNDALERIDARGSTALYDAVVGSLDHLKKGHKDKKVLLVITDGDDDASRLSFAATVKAATQSSAAIYAIGVFSDDDRKSNKKMVRNSRKILTTLAEATGGLAYFPENLADVESVCKQVARDIRNQYTLGYYPTNTAKDGSFRSVQVLVTPARGEGKLSVRTRSGYYAQKPSQGQ
jgi:Ca-activated chloride channel homolog